MNPLARGAIWGATALAIGGIAAMTVAPNDSVATPATHPSADISVAYDCHGNIIRYDVTGDGFDKFVADPVFGPHWKRTLYSAGNLQFKWDKPNGTYWFVHVLVVNGEEFHGNRKVVVKCRDHSSSTTTSTTTPTTSTSTTSTTLPSSTTSVSTTSTTTVPVTSSSVPTTPPTTAPSATTSQPLRVQPSTSPPYTLAATK